MNIQSFARWVYEKFRRTQIVESDDILPVDTGNGIELYFQGDVEAAAAAVDYTGAFKIVKKSGSDTVLQVFDAQEADNYDDATNAGKVYAGLTEILIPKIELTISSSTDIYINLVYVDPNYTTKQMVAGAFSIGVNGTYNHKIGNVVFADSKISTFNNPFSGAYHEVTGRG